MRTVITHRDARAAITKIGHGGAGVFRGILEKQLSVLDSGFLTLRDSDRGEIVVGLDTGLRATMEIHDPSFYRSVVLGGTVGAAESYLRGDWDADDMVSLFRLFALDRSCHDRLEGGFSTLRTLGYRASHWLSSNTKTGSRRNIEAHYDLGNAFFALFLDPSMTYSAGIFETKESTMEEASIAKLDRLCKKIELSSDDHLLEIGTGWGSMAIHAAKEYGCRVTSATLSVEQATLARSRVAEAGLESLVEIVVTDYRDLRGQYDKIVSIEMIEAVGHDHLETYFKTCASLLSPTGLMAIQAITVVDQRYEIARKQVDLIQRLLFPGSDIPSITAMLEATTNASDLRLFHLEDITPHYARTLHCWREKLHENLAAIRQLGGTDSFIRLWDYYFSYCEAGFIERYTGSVQMVFAKPDARNAPILPPLAAHSLGKVS